MRLTIVKDDNAVIVDGEHHMVDCSNLPLDFHALQWGGASGEIEYVATRCEHCGVRAKKGNAIISDLAPYTQYVDEWKRAAIAADEAKAKANAAGSQG